MEDPHLFFLPESSRLSPHSHVFKDLLSQGLLFYDQKNGLFSDNGVIYKNGILYPLLFWKVCNKDSFFSQYYILFSKAV